MDNRTTLSPIERFESKYLVDSETGCWLWTAAVNGNGWATISVDGRATGARRFSYEASFGPLPDGYFLKRGCSTVSCVKPVHMVPTSNDPADRFWAKVDKGDGHWCWRGSSFTFSVDGVTYSPRRYAWSLVRGGDPGELFNLCDGVGCIYPRHCGTAEDRFWTRVDKNEDGHWYWLGARLKTGYPRLTYGGKSMYAHRLAYELAGGILEEGSVLVHRGHCVDLSCIKPKHLKKVGVAERKEEKKLRGKV